MESFSKIHVACFGFCVGTYNRLGSSFDQKLCLGIIHQWNGSWSNLAFCASDGGLVDMLCPKEIGAIVLMCSLNVLCRPLQEGFLLSFFGWSES